MNILIMGLPKSGTSGLAMMIFTAFPGCVRNLERIQYVKDEELAQGNVICKELIDHPNKIGLHGKHYVKYDRLVKIVRDPRDRLVSGILYGGFNTIVDKLDVRDHFLERLRAKEADPMSVNCTELVSILKIKAKTNHPFEIPTLGSEAYMLSTIENLEANFGMPQHTIKYEEFVDKDFVGLQDFLDVVFVKKDVDFSRTSRSKTHGEWKNWLTPYDIEQFKPIFDPIIQKYKYDDWTVNENPYINPEKSSEWAEAKINERYEMHLRGEAAKKAKEEQERLAKEQAAQNPSL